MNYETFKDEAIQRFLKNPLWRERYEGRSNETFRAFMDAADDEG